MPQPHPARPWGRGGGQGGAWGQAAVRWAPWPHLDLDLPALLGTVFCGEPQPNAWGEAWPPWVSEPLCPGAVDLLRRVQKAPARNQLEPEPGIQPPSSPGPLPPWLQLHQAFISSCPRLAAEHALGICHEAAENFATVSRRVSWKRGFPCHPRPLPQGLNREGRRKNTKCQQHLWYLVGQRQGRAPISLP